MKIQEKKELKIFKIIKTHIRNNIKEYFVVSIVFIIGLMIGIIFINNMDAEQKIYISDYIKTFLNNLNNEHKLNINNLLKSSILNNVILGITLWFVGSTVIGIPIGYLLIGIRGFYLGYAISSIMISLPIFKGIGFIFTVLFLQNIFCIPAIFALAVSGIKLYKSIIKEHSKENIKLEIVRHSIFSLIMIRTFSNIFFYRGIHIKQFTDIMHKIVRITL